MEIEISQRKDRPSLSREEVSAVVTYTGATPSRNNVRKELAKVAKAKEDLMVVRRIDTAFGSTKAHVQAFVYKDEKSMKSIEGAYMINRHASKKQEAEEQTASAGEAEAPKEKAASEEDKEEAAKEAQAKEKPEEAKEEPKAEEEKKESDS